ncbi:hypothetical protein [Corynebacterium mayonis]|uniref:hypothetical protein n=1 Tax=Corynebacterium mayonis TaxID=3062461 RepID=UPI003140BF7E
MTYHHSFGKVGGDLHAEAIGAVGDAAAGLDPIEMASEIIVVTRPLNATMNKVFPNVKNRLVRHLLAAWRQPTS